MVKKSIYYDMPLIISIYIASIFTALHGATIYYRGQTDAFIVFKETINSIVETPFNVDINVNTLLFSLIITGFVTLIWIYMRMTAKTHMPGKEYGSARWSSEIEGRKIRNKDLYKNIILTATEMYGLNKKKERKNLNTIVIGSSGSGKTRYHVKPNLMQMNVSLVTTDTKGDLLRSTGKMFEEAGYNIKVLNLIDMTKSNCYNPFSYVKNEVELLKMINMLMDCTTPPNTRSSEKFWVDAEKALLQAISFYLFYEAPKCEKNFHTVMELLRQAEVSDDDNKKNSTLDVMFDELRQENPKHIALKQYDIFKQATGKTAKTILVSLGVRLAMFNIDTVANLTMKDELDIDSLGDEKSILYIIISDSDRTFDFLASMLFTQIFDTLYNKAMEEKKGKLPVHVRCIIDEFSNIGNIPNFDSIMSTIRDREISAAVILQDISQLKAKYKDSWPTIMANSSSLLFLGSNESTTQEYISKKLGKQTIYSKTTGRSRGRSAGSSVNVSPISRDLMTPQEVSRISNTNKCILFVDGMDPFFSKKYDITKHPRYTELGEDGSNIFDLASIKTKPPECGEEEMPEDYEFVIKDAVFKADDIESLEYEVEYEYEEDAV